MLASASCTMCSMQCALTLGVAEAAEYATTAQACTCDGLGLSQPSRSAQACMGQLTLRQGMALLTVFHC